MYECQRMCYSRDFGSGICSVESDPDLGLKIILLSNDEVLINGLVGEEELDIPREELISMYGCDMFAIREAMTNYIRKNYTINIEKLVEFVIFEDHVDCGMIKQ